MAAFYSLRFGPGDRILTARPSVRLELHRVPARSRGTPSARIVPVPERRARRGISCPRLIACSTSWSSFDLAITLYVPTNGGLVDPAEEIGRRARSASVRLPARCLPSRWGSVPIDVEAIGAAISVRRRRREYLRGARGTSSLCPSRCSTGWSRRSSISTRPAGPRRIATSCGPTPGASRTGRASRLAGRLGLARPRSMPRLDLPAIR